ncbi:MAG: hypothetical protein B6D59_04560 [Campylobacteraceae bacterium 4484_4]|nr:MAG: hypothetical protein B6D59_04560 [Campylobacteraceae bacterium 4484_4]
MFRSFLKLLLFMTMFAATEGFGANTDISALYETKLAPAYEKLAPMQKKASEKKSLYIVLAIAAVILFVLAVKFMQLRGAIVVIIFVAAAVAYLQKSEPVISQYQKLFKERILSVIAENTGDYRYKGDALSLHDLKQSRLFGPSVELFRSGDLYEKEGVRRFDDNIFDGIMIEIDHPNAEAGVMISRKLKDAVALQNLSMQEFFADMRRSGEKGAFSPFGKVPDEAVEKAKAFSNLPIGVSFQKEKTYILLYTGDDPLSVDPARRFDLDQARRYAETFETVHRLIETFR